MDDSFAHDLTNLVEQQLRLTEAIRTVLLEHRRQGKSVEIDAWSMHAESFHSELCQTVESG